MTQDLNNRPSGSAAGDGERKGIGVCLVGPVVAPLGPVMLLGVFLAGSTGFEPGAFAGVFLFAYGFYGLPVALIIGVPAVLLLRSAGVRMRPLTCAFAGAVIAAMPLGVFAVWIYVANGKWPEGLYLIAVAAGLGLCSGLFFSLLHHLAMPVAST